MFNQIKEFISYIKKWITIYRFMSIKKNQKFVVFYSENKNYWIDLKGIIEELIKTTDVSIYYISSDYEDPGLSYKNNRINKLVIDEGYQRIWFFQNLESHILITTTPGLDTFIDFKKSKKTDYYVYTQHGLVSTHCVYNKNAFDNYDIIFCTGKYMIEEIRKQERIYNLKAKTLVEHGFSKLDYITREYLKYEEDTNNTKASKIILIAPTWGSDGIIESRFASNYIDEIISQGYSVILRPHPETVKRSRKKIDDLLNIYLNNNAFSCELNITSFKNLFLADILVTDWSGIAIEYAFATNKMVLFLDTPQKIFNKDYFKLELDAFESEIREKIGYIWNGKDNISSYAAKLDESVKGSDYIYNLGKSDKIASEFIAGLINDIQKNP